MKPKTLKQLEHDVNNLRSRHVSWQYKQTTVWKEKEWLDAHTFNAAIMELLETPIKIKVRHGEKK